MFSVASEAVDDTGGQCVCNADIFSSNFTVSFPTHPGQAPWLPDSMVEAGVRVQTLVNIAWVPCSCPYCHGGKGSPEVSCENTGQCYLGDHCCCCCCCSVCCVRYVSSVC